MPRRKAAECAPRRQSIKDNNFNGQNCVHFLRDMDECAKNDPSYGVKNQKAIRENWKRLTGETVD